MRHDSTFQDRRTILAVCCAMGLFGFVMTFCGCFDLSDDASKAFGPTWTDPLSGLTWQVTPPTDYMDWEDAKSYCESLSLGGGGWHLPTISELRTLIRGCDATETGGSCGVTDDCMDYLDCWNGPCDGCEYLDGPGSGGAYWPDGMTGNIGWYWSSSPVADDDVTSAWVVYFDNGSVDGYFVGSYYDHARCVR